MWELHAANQLGTAALAAVFINGWTVITLIGRNGSSAVYQRCFSKRIFHTTARCCCRFYAVNYWKHHLLAPLMFFAFCLPVVWRLCSLSEPDTWTPLYCRKMVVSGKSLCCGQFSVPADDDDDDGAVFVSACQAWLQQSSDSSAVCLRDS